MNIANIITRKYQAYSGHVNIRVHALTDDTQTITVSAKSHKGGTYSEEYLCDLMGEVKSITDVRTSDKPFVLLPRSAQPTIAHQTWGYWNRKA